MKPTTNMNRRQLLKLAAGLTAGLGLAGHAQARLSQIRKAIPSTGEQLPVIGMGTSRTFDIDVDDEQLAELKRVVQTFFEMGGGLIDSSPMYGSAEQMIGKLLPGVKNRQALFSASKVWTEGRQAGIEQMEQSRRLWGIRRFDLMQIHNLVDWKIHLETLQQMKAQGKIRYIGITTSHGRSHDVLSDALRKNDFDFVQLSYSIANREVESPLLSIARDRGIAVIVNRPYQRGDLFKHVRGKPLPAWAQDFDCNSWGQFFLKYVVSHPAVTCAIPATSKVKHISDNIQAGFGRLPTEKQRTQMLSYFEAL